MLPTAPVVFLLDVDNTLLDNDQVTRDLKQHLVHTFGPDREQRFWSIFEDCRKERGYADYLGALQRYRVEHPHDPSILQMSLFLVDYPFRTRIFPGALDVIRWLRDWGPAVILSDGDAVFQPLKVQRSGIMDAVDNNVLIYIHKEEQLADVERHYPAKQYVLIDDKLRILTAVKKIWGTRVTTVFPRQGHYAHDEQIVESNPPADITIDQIADLQRYDLPTLLAASGGPA
ncbi:MAG: HAD family hydrolase [Planctomycetes bacterium]|nr:HAD family hydrolase [Planctomycetota bacterium]